MLGGKTMSKPTTRNNSHYRVSCYSLGSLQLEIVPRTSTHSVLVLKNTKFSLEIELVLFSTLISRHRKFRSARIENVQIW